MPELQVQFEKLFVNLIRKFNQYPF